MVIYCLAELNASQCDLKLQGTDLVFPFCILDRERMDRKCTNHPDKFFYICGNVILPGRLANITDFVKKAYHAYFGVKLGDQDKPFALHVSCKTCVENLRNWRDKIKEKYVIRCSYGVERGRSCDRLLFLHD